MIQSTFENDIPDFGSAEELERRLAQVHPGDTMRGFIFNGILTIVGNESDEAAVQRCIEASGDQEFMDFFLYPITSLLRLFYMAAWELSEKHGGFAQSIWYLGNRVTPEYLESALGKALRVVAGNNAHHMASAMPEAHRTATSHAKIQLTWTGLKQGLFTYRDNLIPYQYYQGALHYALASTGPKGLRLKGRQTGPQECEVAFSWE